MKRLASWSVLFLLAWAAYGCASRVVPGRLYSLDRPERSTMTFQFSGQRNGIARASLPSGETLTGEFVIWVQRSGAFDAKAWEEVGGRIKSGDRSADMEWPVVYGYGSKSEEVDPVGSAVLVGNSGTTLEIVLYHAVYDASLVGDGLARDNKGDWYRVMLGKLD
jgi:hypothetical protein